MNYVTNENFLLYAARHYDNPSCATKSDFMQDINRITFILKMFKKYEKDGIINERLILNHLILLYNVFEREAITRMLALRLKQYLHMLKPFLLLLNFWPDRILHVETYEAVIIDTDIMMDAAIVEKLRKI